MSSPPSRPIRWANVRREWANNDPAGPPPMTATLDPFPRVSAMALALNLEGWQTADNRAAKVSRPPLADWCLAGGEPPSGRNCDDHAASFTITGLGDALGNRARVLLARAGADVVKCPRCAFENPAGVRFCGQCGARLDEGAVPRVPLEERKGVTMLFADVTGSTTLAERRDPEEMRSIMGRFFDAMSRVIVRYGGAVEKFIGDEVMAVFGLPAAHQDDPERTVRAARGGPAGG